MFAAQYGLPSGSVSNAVYKIHHCSYILPREEEKVKKSRKSLLDDSRFVVVRSNTR